LNVPNGLSGSAAPRCTRRQRFRIPLGTPSRLLHGPQHALPITREVAVQPHAVHATPRAPVRRRRVERSTRDSECLAAEPDARLAQGNVDTCDRCSEHGR